MNRYPLIAASMILLIAGLAVWNRNSNDGDPLRPADSAQPKAPLVTTATRGNASVKRQAVVTKSTSRAENSIARLTVTSMEPTQQESCRKVEAEAHRELAKLSELVNLSATQKPRIFQILVQSADDFDPAMLVADAPAGELTESPEDAICEVLNPAQEAAFQEELLDDAAWWDDAIAQMEAGLDKTAPAIPEIPLTEVEP